jgi:hypothetical protein
MKTTVVLFIIIFLIGNVVFAQGGFTQTDRDNLNRIQIEMREGFKSVDLRLELMQKQIDETKKQIEDSRSDSTSLTLTFFGFIFAGYIALFGFIYWDRRTAVKSVELEQLSIISELKIYKEKVNNFEKIFKEVSAGKPLSPDLLHQFGI